MAEALELTKDFEEVEALPSIDPEQLKLPIINGLVVKVHSRCDLDCDYCYVYNLGDDSWRDQPRVMSDKTVEATARSLGEYLRENPQLQFTITFHGGETLLVPKGFFDKAVQTFFDIVGEATNGNTDLLFTLQTNGRGLNEERLQEIRRNGIQVGVSLDGDREASDRHRRKRGKDRESSHDDAVRGVRNMVDDERFRKHFAGFLAVMDIQNDPDVVYDYLLQFQPPFIDFILPLGNWKNRPAGLEPRPEEIEYLRMYDPVKLEMPNALRTNATPYADWLKRILDRWYPDQKRKTEIRIFDAIIRAKIGRNSGSQSIGDNGEFDILVVETDGSYEMVDSYKSDPGRVAKTGLNVFRNSMKDAVVHIAKKAKYLGADKIPDECGPCLVRDLCGGGFETQRYMPDEENPGRYEGTFNHRSVYCNDLVTYITEVELALTRRARQIHFERMRSAYDGRQQQHFLAVKAAKAALSNAVELSAENG